jgi:mannose-6-phosphate isomerase-like protein (cupin superfamily)
MATLKQGDVLYDSVGGAQVTLVELTPDGFVIEQQSEAGKTGNRLNHLHESWTETFEIISGQGRCDVGGAERDVKAGDIVSVQPRQTHIHPWNTGAEPLHFRQRSVFVPANATAAVDTFLGFSTLFGLAREGKTNRAGIPRNPLQLLVILDFFRQHGGYLAGLPIGVQDALMGGGAALGRALGYRAWYERYLP